MQSPAKPIFRAHRGVDEQKSAGASPSTQGRRCTRKQLGPPYGSSGRARFESRPSPHRAPNGRAVKGAACRPTSGSATAIKAGKGSPGAGTRTNGGAGISASITRPTTFNRAGSACGSTFRGSAGGRGGALARRLGLVTRTMGRRSITPSAATGMAGSSATGGVRSGSRPKEAASPPLAVDGTGNAIAGNKRRAGRPAPAPGGGAAFSKHASPLPSTTRASSGENGAHAARGRSNDASVFISAASRFPGSRFAETDVTAGSRASGATGPAAGSLAVIHARLTSCRSGRWSITPRSTAEASPAAHGPHSAARGAKVITAATDLVNKGGGAMGRTAGALSTRAGTGRGDRPSPAPNVGSNASVNAAALLVTTLASSASSASGAYAPFNQVCANPEELALDELL